MQSSVYRYVHKGYCSFGLLDLPRAVKLKPRHKHAATYVPKGIRVGRSYQDFQELMCRNPFLNVVEMDTVIGRPGGKVLMTFQVVQADFMFALLLDNKSATEAAARITALKERLKALGFSFGELFPVLLTDNGGEFSRVSAFENDVSGTKETSVFFCDPNAPYPGCVVMAGRDSPGISGAIAASMTGAGGFSPSILIRTTSGCTGSLRRTVGILSLIHI